MLVGNGPFGQARIELMSRTGALWLLTALAGCATEADFRGEVPSLETSAWEGGDSTQPQAGAGTGLTAALDLQDLTGIDDTSSDSAGLLSKPSSASGTDTAQTDLGTASDHLGSCSVPGSLSSGATGSLTESEFVSTTSSQSTTSQTPDQTTSSAPGTTSESTTTTTSTTTQTDDSSSAGASELCGNLPFDAVWLRQKLSEFTGAVPTSILGAIATIGERSSIVGRADARAWLAEQYSLLGYRLDGHDYPGGTNVFAERRGSGEGVIIVSSHYDTVAGTVGADDDGSGVVVGLAVAAALARCQPEKTVRIIAFDQEENGMLGSRAYVRSLQNSGQAQNIAGVIQVEMAGYDRNNDGFINRVDCGHTNNRFIVDALSATISNERLALTAIGECKGRSDHVSFWDANIPAVTVSEHFFGDRAERNPCYHQSCDTVNSLNFDFMNKVARAVTLTTIALAGAE